MCLSFYSFAAVACRYYRGDVRIFRGCVGNERICTAGKILRNYTLVRLIVAKIEISLGIIVLTLKTFPVMQFVEMRSLETRLPWNPVTTLFKTARRVVSTFVVDILVCRECLKKIRSQSRFGKSQQSTDELSKLNTKSCKILPRITKHEPTIGTK